MNRSLEFKRPGVIRRVRRRTSQARYARAVAFLRRGIPTAAVWQKIAADLSQVSAVLERG